MELLRQSDYHVPSPQAGGPKQSVRTWHQAMRALSLVSMSLFGHTHSPVTGSG